MRTPSALDQGRESFARQRWGDAYTSLAAADRESPLVLDDLERLATAAYLIGNDSESEDLLVPKVLHIGGPLIRVKRKHLANAGVERLPKVVGVRDGLPLLEDGRVADVANIVWCTGFRPGFSWIDLPVFDEDGLPLQHRGVVPNEPGLYFLGLHFLYALSSTMIHGVGRDAAYIAQVIATRTRAANAA